jgi:GNAT superfamily N-acetyltransferase
MLRSLRARLLRAADPVRALGLGRGLSALPPWFLWRREFVAVAWPIPARPIEITLRPGVEWRVLDEAGLPAFVAECPELAPEEIRRRWAAGLESLVLRHDRTIVAYRWDAIGAVDPLYLPYLRRIARLAPGDALVYDTWTLPARRRLRLGAELVAAAMERARQRGNRRYVGLIATWNRPSLRWAEHLGWVRLGTVGWRRVGLRRRYFATGALAIVDGEARFLPPVMPGGQAHGGPTS